MKFFYWLCLGLALFAGVEAAFAQEWLVVVGAFLVILFFISLPEDFQP